jgi:hypothetical protein
VIWLLGEEGHDERREELSEAQGRYNKRVQAYVRKRERERERERERCMG